MLTLEQIKHFQTCVTRAQKIIVGPERKREEGDLRYHIRVSGRQMADGSHMIGLIFGTRKESEWLKIATVPEDDLVQAKQTYRAMLHDIIHTK
ncbi:hypothetical protein GTB64_004540 [Salmonella enterica]|nr:hypothetical protein [Salmonella enterica]